MYRNGSQVVNRLLVFVLCASLIGCSTTRAVQFSEPAEIRQSVMVGDKVEIRHVDGKVFKFKVAQITEDSISGDGNTLLWENIDAIRIRQFSASKTAGAVGAGVGVAWFVAMLGTLATVAFFAAIDDDDD